MDGGETSGDSGGVRLTVSQDEVQEFQINRSNYGADLGAATGAFHQYCDQVRHRQCARRHSMVFSATTRWTPKIRFPSARHCRPARPSILPTPTTFGSPIKDTLSRQQYGGTLGFPIKKDKTFLFVAFEGLRQNAQNAVPLLIDTEHSSSDDGAETTSLPRLEAEPLYDTGALLAGLLSATELNAASPSRAF